jgi:hypothetical protein
VNDAAAVPLPLSLHSFTRATFTTATLLAFGAASVLAGGDALRWIGVVLVVVSVIEGSDFFVFARRWAFVDQQFRIPRWWAPQRSVPVTADWVPSRDDVSRRDTMFRAETPTGPKRVVPNLMVVRSDVMAWLDVIGEQRTHER